MQKVISLFKRDYEGNRQVLDEVVEGAEWVIAGEGRATEKIDGTSCLIKGGNLYKRYDAKRGKTPPSDFEPAQEHPDVLTGHWPGWLPVKEAPEDKWHKQAWENGGRELPDGTYELIGPKVQGNKYNLFSHKFRLHGDVILEAAPIDFNGVREYLEIHPEYEGIVWHHLDGRMVKIKRRDFGLSWS